MFLGASHAYAQDLYSSAIARVNGITPKSTVSLEVENNSQTYEMTASKDGSAMIVGSFPENLEVGVSSGINYILRYKVPYKNLDGLTKDVENILQFSFSAHAGDVIFLGQATDTALVEYASGADEMRNVTASTSGIFRGGNVVNSRFAQDRKGHLFVVITNTNPETGDPLPPVYIEAGFALAEDQKRVAADENGLLAIFQNSSRGQHVFTDSGIRGSWGNDLYRLSRQFSANIMTQAGAIGAILDAYVTHYKIRTIAVLQAEAGQRYKPSVNMCKYASLNKSSARASLGARAQSQIFAKYLQDFDMKHHDSVGGAFASIREADYIRKFVDHYCHPQQNGPEGLTRFCAGASVQADRVNSDINFPALFSTRLSIGTGFLNRVDPILGGPSPDEHLLDGEEDLFLLTHNLFNSNVPSVSETIVKSYDGERAITDLRSLQAIRNVAKNSMATLVGNKSGSVNLGLVDQLANVVVNKGPANVGAYFGVDGGTAGLSYDGLMEIITKKLYQDPAFYANLYDSPENVMRQKTSIKAIQLMQGWDIVKALHRREMLLAMMIELKIREKQRAIEANLDNVVIR